MKYPAVVRLRAIRQTLMGLVFIAILSVGWWFPYFGYFIPFCMLMGIGLALFQGKTWCDWYCPRGSFLDRFVKPLSPNRPLPATITGMPLRVAAIFFLLTMMTVQIVIRWPDSSSIGHFFLVMLTITTGLGVLLAVIYQQRAWCYLCPIGTMSNWAGKSRRPMTIDSARCNDCGRCQAVCPMQINPQRHKATGCAVVREGDCLKCRLCVAACPRQALTP